MSIFLDEHQTLFANLIDAGVEFLIIGGYAVNFYGYNRVTGDVDLWIKPDNSNRDRLIGVLSSMGFNESGLEKLKEVDFTGTFVFTIWEEPYKVDFLTRISGAIFHDVYSRKNMTEIGGLRLPFISFGDLVASKMSTNRLRDKADVEELQKIASLKS